MQKKNEIINNTKKIKEKTKFRMQAILYTRFELYCNLKNPVKILPPSNGYAGSRLNRAIEKFETTKEYVKTYVSGKIHQKAIVAPIKNKLTIGPAKAILTSSFGSKENSSNERHAPKGRIHILFNLYPNFFATYACPNSCKTIAIK